MFFFNFGKIYWKRILNDDDGLFFDAKKIDKRRWTVLQFRIDYGGVDLEETYGRAAVEFYNDEEGRLWHFCGEESRQKIAGDFWFLAYLQLGT